jgi:kumamolisin
MDTKKLLLVLGVVCVNLAIPSVALAAFPDGVAMTESVLPFSQDVKVVGTANPDATVQFDIVLKIRDYDRLREHLAAGERLTAKEIAARHFPLAQDYQSLIQWAGERGLTIEKTYDHRLTLRLSGTVNLVQQVLGVKFVQVIFEGKPYIATSKAPRIPGNFRPFVLGINGLQPYHHVRTMARPQPESPTNPFKPPYSVNDIKTAYNATSISATGAGQRTAILIDTFPLDNDLTAFWSANGIDQSLSNIEKVQVVSGTLPDPSGEESLDVEWTSSLAPQSKVRVYATTSLMVTDIDTGFQQIISDLQSGLAIQQLSISLGACESEFPPSQKTTNDQFFAVIASSGVSTFLSSGDSGSRCGDGTTTGVEFYSSSPNVASVGGTKIILSSSGVITNETGWTGSGGGTSTFFAKPSWQVGTGVPNSTFRSAPDIAINGDPNSGYYIVVNGVVKQVGGTSASAPVWAGFTALINQGRAGNGKPSLGLIGPVVYPLLGTANFRDITSGNNGGFTAAPGYDLVTGIGVPVVSTLYNTLVNTTVAITAANLRFYPLPSCRIVDTRNTSVPNLPVGTPTAFVVNGGGSTFNYASQGGSAIGCGIPTDAKAVFFNFVAVNVSGSGFFQAWPSGSAIPTASVLNYANVPNLNIANGIVLPICDSTKTTCTKDLSVQANQASMQLVVDVGGYFK